jgi:hypothetical protein
VEKNESSEKQEESVDQLLNNMLAPGEDRSARPLIIPKVKTKMKLLEENPA